MQTKTDPLSGYRLGLDDDGMIVDLDNGSRLVDVAGPRYRRWAAGCLTVWYCLMAVFFVAAACFAPGNPWWLRGVQVALAFGFVWTAHERWTGQFPRVTWRMVPVGVAVRSEK